MSSVRRCYQENRTRERSALPGPARNSKTKNPLWNYGKLSHLPTVPQYGGDRDGSTIYDSGGPKKAKTKAKNSLDNKTEKSDNGICYVTN
jgi:hypothetical protein